MESLVDKLMSSGIDVYAIADQLKKPLRPIWFTPQSCDTIVPDFDDCSFWPVVCLSASEAVENGYQARPGYLYVQGSGDDQEAWCLVKKMRDKTEFLGLRQPPLGPDSLFVLGESSVHTGKQGRM
jgi:hypothetical protein